jgi:hypothetical protein
MLLQSIFGCAPIATKIAIPCRDGRLRRFGRVLAAREPVAARNIVFLLPFIFFSFARARWRPGQRIVIRL